MFLTSFAHPLCPSILYVRYCRRAYGVPALNISLEKKSVRKKPAANSTVSVAVTGKAPKKSTSRFATQQAPAKKSSSSKWQAASGLKAPAGVKAKVAASKTAKTSGVTKTPATPRGTRSPVSGATEKYAPDVASLRRHVLKALEDMKAKEIREIDIRGKASFADLLVIASGTSTRHVKSLADEVVKLVKKAGMMPLGVEGEKEAEWVLVDLGDIVCHLMLPRIREFYALERLWSVGDALEPENS